MLSKEEQPITTNQLAEELVGRLRQMDPDERFLLGIVGYPGAGKSTTAQALAAETNSLLANDCCAVIPMDGFHYSNEKLNEMGLLPLKGIPATFDAYGFITLLKQLRNNKNSVFAPKFDRSIEASIENAIEVNPAQRLLIVEGNYLLLDDQPWNQIRDLLDEVWFLDTDFDTVYHRLIDRHMQGGKTEEAAREKVESTDMPNARLIAASRQNAQRLARIAFMP